MFGFSMDSLWPVKTFLDFFFNTALDKCFNSTIDIAKLEKEIRSNSFCEVENLELNILTINKKLFTHSPIEVKYGKIEKLYINFPKNYIKEKTVIKIDCLNLSISPKNLNEIDPKDFVMKKIEEIKTSVLGPLLGLVNILVENVELSCKNISIHFVPLYTEKIPTKSILKFLIGGINYCKTKDNEKNSLFLFNKQITVNNLLLKIEDVTEEDLDNFQSDTKFFKLFEDKKENELINFYTDSDCILVVNSSFSQEESFNYCSFIVKLEKDVSNKENLIISSIIDKIELILTKNQLNVLLQILYFINKLNEKFNNLVSDFQSQVTEVPKKLAHLEILNYKLSNIILNLEISNINILILENTTSKNLYKPKMWLMYDFYYKKYYLSLDNDNKDNFNSNLINNIQRHFCYLEDNFFILNFSKITFGALLNFNTFNKENKKIKFGINEINFRYVEPNSMPIKKDLIVINNIITNDVEKYFHEKFNKVFLNSIKYGHYAFNIVSLNNIEGMINLNLNIVGRDYYYEFLVLTNLNEIEIDINFMIIMKLNYLLMFYFDEYNSLLAKFSEIKFNKSKNTGDDQEPNPTRKSKNSEEEPNNSQMNNTINLLPNEIKKRGSIVDLVSNYEKRIKDIQDEVSQTLISPAKKSLYSVPSNYGNKVPLSNPKEEKINTSDTINYFISANVLITFKLTVKIIALNHLQQLFKDFYTFNMHNLFENKANNFIYTGKNQCARYLLKIAENVSREFVTLKFDSCELLILKKLHNENKNFQTDNKNFTIYCDFSKFYVFYCMINVYFPIIIYKNTSFNPALIDSPLIASLCVNGLGTQVNAGKNTFVNIEVDYDNIESSKQWLLMINYKIYLNKDIFDESFFSEVKYFLNAHHISKNENFILDEIQNKKLRSYVDNSMKVCPLLHKQFSFHFNFYKLDILLNYIYLSRLIEFSKIMIFSSTYVKIFSEALKGNFSSDMNNNDDSSSFTFDISIKEINIIGFSNIYLDLIEDKSDIVLNTSDNLSLTDINFLMRYLIKDENIFNIIDNPFLKIQFNDYKFTSFNTNKNYIISSLDNFKILIRKNENNYHDIGIKYQIFFQGIYEDENFDHFVYRGKSKTISNSVGRSNLISALLKFDNANIKNNSIYKNLEVTDMSDFINKIIMSEKSMRNNNLSISVAIDDFVICPVFYNFEDSMKLLEEIKNGYFKMKVIIKNEIINLYGLSSLENNFKNEIQKNEKLFNPHAEINKLEMNLNIQISRVILDMFSYSLNKNSNPNQIELKDKMRFITEIEGISFEEIRKELSESIHINVINSSNVQSVNIGPHLFNLSINRINSIFLKNLDFRHSFAHLINKCQNISKENSYWMKKGFVEIFNLENLQILLSEIDKNFKSEFIINSMEFLFCKDSFRKFIKFISKCKNDLTSLVGIIMKYGDYDKESVITELEMIQDKYVNEQIQFPMRNAADSSIEYKNVSHHGNSGKIDKKKSQTERAQSADQKKETTNKQFSYNMKPLAGSWKENKIDTFYVLDNNFDRRSNSSSLRNKKNENFNSEIYSNNGKPADILKTDDINNNSDNLNNSIMSSSGNVSNNEKEIASKITEKLNLFFITHNFKFYMFEGKDFAFVDTYTSNINNSDETHSNLSEFGDKPRGLIKSDVDFSVTINVNPSSIKLYDDYILTKTTSNSTNNGKLVGKSGNYIRLRSLQRNYFDYILFIIDDIELNNSPIVFSHLLEIRKFQINDFIKDSKFKKVLSAYNYEDECKNYNSNFLGQKFLTLKLDVIKCNKKDMEICLFLQIIPLNILIDQLSLKFIIKFLKIKLEDLISDLSSTGATGTAEDQNQSIIISQINAENMNIASHLDTSNRFFNKNNFNFFARRIIIQEFFVNISYNAQRIQFDNLKDKQIFEYINISSIHDLKINLKTFDFKGKKNLSDITAQIFEDWKNDILKEQIINAYLSSISVIKPFKNIIGGFIEIFKQPYNSYKEDRSIQDGFANGMRDFVVTFSTEALTVGERIYNLMKGIFGTKNKKKKSIYRKIVYIINEEKMKYDNYFLKD